MLPLGAVNVPPHAAVRTMIKQSRTNTKYSFFLTYKEDEDATEKVFLLSFFITFFKFYLLVYLNLIFFLTQNLSCV